MSKGMFNIFEPHATFLYDKPVSTKYEKARILITVKTRPEPSKTYGETVCIAGLRIDPDPEGLRIAEDIRWVRLYPVPFRKMAEYLQFEKYSIIEAPIMPTARGKDFRSESYRPNRMSLKILSEKPLKWKQRLQYVEPLVSTMTMCEIIRNCVKGKQQKPYPSLAVIRPYGPTKLVIKSYEGWTEDQKKYVQGAHLQKDLFDDQLEIEPNTLQEPRYQGYIRYYCSPECKNGHEQMFLDWEFEALSLRHREEPDAVAREAIYQRYRSILDPSKKPLLYVGNQKKYPAAFSVLGIQRTA